MSGVYVVRRRLEVRYSDECGDMQVDDAGRAFVRLLGQDLAKP